MSKERAKDWLQQAQNDILFAQEGLKLQFYSQTCFLCQQAAEKAIKSLAYFRDYEIRGHSITIIAKSMKINSEVERAGRILDLYYISTRYPDALPGGAPFEFFTKEQATEALELANIIIAKAIEEVTP
ncbi:MAG: HEPN domain-containing protein [Oligoflexia bacterium]|nr:HEPN domain-containing protein [Oligoflexia bacterium]MBF0366779.1 HEPN domain-containing protein [Oligoflexia bacterium]